MPRIVFKNVTKQYRNVVAVDKISFEIEDGEYVTLLGPSGCGKTTTLKLLAGLRVPDEGEIWIDNRIVNNIPPEDRDIGFVFQHFAIFPHMTVWENVTYSLRLKGWSDVKIQKVAWDALEMVKLADKIDLYPSQLSAPELQRVGLARAIAKGSKILLLDEPLSMLDLKVRQVFRHEIRKLVKKLGLTAIHVTHDQEEAMAISDKIIVMRRGKIVQIGSPRELYKKPKTLFVANFIGESNFFVGYVESVSKDFSTIRIRGDYILKSNRTEFSKGDMVVVAIRKEKFHILNHNNQVPHKENVITGELILKRSVGFYSRLRVRLRSGDIIEIKVSTLDALRLPLNSNIAFTVNPEDVLVYPYPKEGLEKALSVV